MNLVEHAKQELEISGLLKEDSCYDGELGKSILKIVECFSSQGHSGNSASMSLSILKNLLDWKPITPLTGEDGEWVEVTDGCFQNRRCSAIFKQKDRFNGQAYYIYAVVFEEPNGVRFTSGDSFRPIEFPYVPKTEIVKVQESK